MDKKYSHFSFNDHFQEYLDITSLDLAIFAKLLYNLFYLNF